MRLSSDCYISNGWDKLHPYALSVQEVAKIFKVDVTSTGLSTLLGKRLITSYLKNMKRNIIKKYVLGFKGEH